MKSLLIALFILISPMSNISANPPQSYDYQYNSVPSPYVTLRAHQRILWLRDQMYQFQQMMKYNRASRYQIALYNKLLQEHNYLVRKFGNPT